MSEFHQQTVPTEPRTPLSLSLLRIPFGNAEPADEDLFPPIRPPAADVTAPQAADDAEEGEEDAATDADADVDVGMGDGSDASEESDEVSSSVLKQYFLLFLKMKYRTSNS
jgi:hypothetical protein